MLRLPAILRTSVFQITLLYVALFAVSVAALSAFIYWSTVGYLERQTDAVLQAELEGLEEQYRQRGIGGLVDVIQSRVRNDTGARSVYQLVDSRLRPLAGNIGYWPPPFDRPGVYVEFLREVPAGGTVPVRALVMQVGPGFRLLDGRDVRELERIRDVFVDAALWGAGLTIGLALLGGLALGLGAERRTAQLNRTTRRIIAGDLSQRIPLRGTQDEHEELAVNVNRMLDRIETLMAGMRHVGDSIAHDLRSPLTRLRTRLELLAESGAPSRESIVECLEQADGLLETFNALLRISRVESGTFRSAFAEVDLSRVVRDVCDMYQASAEDAGLSFDYSVADDAHVFGDRELLAQALTNLLDNAIKYSPGGGRVRVTLEAADDTVRVIVADTGPGIAAADRERVLQRFARLDNSRSKPGNGLGLPLVKAVADQHGAHLELGDNDPGLVVTLELPEQKKTRPLARPGPGSH